MSAGLVLYEARPPAAVITLNSADKRNALSQALITAIGDAFERAKNDAAARCVVLTAAGSVFCAGMDPAELQSSLDQPKAKSPVWADALPLAKPLDPTLHPPKPALSCGERPSTPG